ncbi:MULTISPECIES: GTP 3',8-cyclase MoaA [Pseudomonas]|jgi:cyclic pyranopterin phosphate synthase|uniref:GTP 3',8-cyclase n=1 Tax=Pseudomonas citronellolis TaxID=53408 RepID=A0A1A9KFN0_9PSED|nr:MULTISPECIES: GTP 3',8-cyclase MoaA [Pseudomonas]KSW22825.1 cyclic pyranopterin phosphate synthase MoaA [Pseudomonas sp. ADP]ANI16324.1 cyclic pyranopterin phosphate synthase MoaA [Pseudomonas citronellolis]KWR75220.1 cyclic pyranopterin phosphate synthase MoaA [Pseudomonas sp. PI1]MBB1605613.1 cyclic pyranopterin phosphate synthase MoaA [Pseudomonas sp. UMC76]MBB1639682.1 cyclic pyranopterin phosphate synthase MoaA [Pseudomonas sp. UME83]
MSDSQLVDPFGRRITYLRLSVTDRCDFRCTYCMSEDMQFLPRDQVLSLEELYAVADAFIALGVRRIRITGGEPLVRKGLTSLLARLGARPELEDLAITSNGSQLAGRAAELRAAGVRRLNISLDSLRRERFAAFTRSDRLPQVLAGIEAARAAGFERIKLNCVVQKGRNDDEVCELVEYALARGLDISFIEEMPLGSISSHDRAQTLCSSDEVRARLAEHWQLTPSLERSGGPSRYYRVDGLPSRIGFISPHSHNFCGDCNRVRVTAEGRLVLCLGHEGALDLRQLLRSHPGDGARLRAALVEALQLKPQRHHFDAAGQVQVLRFMSMTGG